MVVQAAVYRMQKRQFPPARFFTMVSKIDPTLNVVTISGFILYSKQENAFCGLLERSHRQSVKEIG